MSSITVSSPIVEDVGLAVVTVTARDAGGRPVTGVPVFVAASGIGNAITQSERPTNINGRATAFVASSVPGLKIVSAWAGGILLIETAELVVQDTFVSRGPLARYAPHAPAAVLPLQRRSLVVISAAHAVTFIGQPSNVVEDTVVIPAITVGVYDAAAALIPTATDLVALGVATGPGVLGGTTARQAVNGVASFDDVTLSDPGTCTLMASATGVLSDVSDPFTVSASGGGGGLWPNEPAGATLLFDESWNTEPPTGIWQLQGGAGNLAIVIDATAPISPSNVIRVRFPAGCCDGVGPAHFYTFQTPGNNYSQFYLAWYWKYSANFRSPATMIKQCDVFFGDETYIPCTIVDLPPWNPRHVAFGNGTQAIDFGTELFPLTWYLYECLVTRVSGTTLRHRMFVDGNPSLDTNYTWTTTNIGQISFAWVQGGVGATVPADQDAFVDHIRCSYIP